MDLENLWQEALEKTQILRYRLKPLLTFQTTTLSYIFLSESVVNLGDVVVRKGNILVDKPLILLPPNYPQFQGFEFEEEEDQFSENDIRSFFLMRGIVLPSLKYNNKSYSIETFEGSLEKAIDKFSVDLEQKKDIDYGLITGADDSWNFSLLIYVTNLMNKFVGNDLMNLFKKYKNN
ncbi:MAG: hypothetical protein ABIB46_04830 [bacterium]